ncbi:hypothetical protein G3I60_40035 [Streptomyces sp. SID13666]|uniref:hypothetical protein n=1 Tax=unclassified Streptomyces TaxID=2593676 RepID=UPI0013C1F524|nr:MULTISPECIES: hypothetical protein [unclassified Streptomyces]MCZ4101306.1 hypothetical protein [Streptomyces sp. H39-C1]NEA60192.1 hypothetical protein [Streptomyces sp. SID13666]
MPPDPAPATARRAVSSLDHRIEAVTGHDVDTLWTYRDREVLDEPHTRLVDRHRELAQAETGVTFYRTLLHRLTSGEFPVDGPLFERIDRTVDQLEEAADTRDTAAQRVIAALEPIEAAGPTAPAAGGELISAADQAALLSIAAGAKVHAHLLTGRMSVPTSTGTRVLYTHLQQLEAAGLVSRDTSHTAEAGQPVTLTDTGRAALARSREHRPAAVPPAPKADAWPAAPIRLRR